MCALLLMCLLCGCGPGMLYAPADGRDPWPQSGAGVQGTAFRADGPTPPLDTLWQAGVGAAPVGGPLVVGQLVLQATAGKTLVALDVRDGTRVGKLGLRVQVCGPPAAAGALFVWAAAGDQPRLVGFDTRARKRVWDVPGGFSAPLTAVGDTVLAPEAPGTLLALAAPTGEEIWRADVGGRLNTGVGVLGDAVYVGSSQGDVVRVDLATGEVLWRQSVGSGVRAAPLPVANRVFAATAAGAVVALDADTGASLWRTSVHALPSDGMAIGDNMLLVGSADRSCYALDAATGQVRWRLPVDGVVRGAPATTGTVAYCATTGGGLRAADLHTGRQLWACALDAPVLAPVTLGQGMVLVTTQKGTVYAFGAN